MAHSRGGLLALVSLSIVMDSVYQTWCAHKVKPSCGMGQIQHLAPFHIAGVSIWRYGYVLYDLPAAIKLTADIVLVILLAVVILAALLSAAGSSKGRSGKSSSNTSPSSDSPRSSGGPLGSLTLDPGARPHPDAASTLPPGGPSGAIVPPSPVPTALASPLCGKALFIGPSLVVCPACSGRLPSDLLPPGPS